MLAFSLSAVALRLRQKGVEQEAGSAAFRVQNS